MSLRDQEQFIVHLNIVLRTFPPKSYLSENLVVFLLTLKTIDKALYQKLTHYEFKIPEIKQFLDVFPKGSYDIEHFLETVKVDLYFALKKKRKYSRAIDDKLKNEEANARNPETGKQSEKMQQFFYLYRQREHRYNIDLDTLIKKIELLDDLKINE